jgi:hypothetical protein
MMIGGNMNNLKEQVSISKLILYLMFVLLGFLLGCMFGLSAQCKDCEDRENRGYIKGNIF